MRHALILGLVLAGCSAKVDEAELWTITQFQNPHDANEDFGGWLPAQLVLKPGVQLPFREADAQQVSGVLGLAIFPGVADGVSTPFTVTEVWKKHPEPWIQPVWSPRNASDKTKPLGQNVFPFGAEASFYSPFWKLELLLLDDASKAPRTPRQALDSSAPRADGPRVMCPVIPDVDPLEVGLSEGGKLKDPVDPATLALVKKPRFATAFIDGDQRELHYLDFGEDRFIEDGQRVVGADAFFFFNSDGTPLPSAAVLPSDPRRHPLVRRVNVTLPAGGRRLRATEPTRTQREVGRARAPSCGR